MVEPNQPSPVDPDLQLLRNWAPILNINPGEQYLPSSVNWYVGQCQLIDPSGQVVPGTGDGITDPSVLADSTLDQHLGFRLHPLNQSVYNGQKGTTLNNVPCYAFVRVLNDGNGQVLYRDLVYWFFYPYNGNIFDIGALAGYLTAGNLLIAGITSVFFWPGLLLLPVIALDTVTSIIELAYSWDGLGKHEGDWESVIVRLAADGTFHSMYFSEHSGMTSEPYSGVTWSNDHRPCVYVAQSSHANYPTPGSRSLDGGLADDVSVDSSTNPAFLWDTQSSLVNIGWFQGTVNMRLVNWTGLSGTLPIGSPSIAVNNNSFWISAGTTALGSSQPTYINLGRSSGSALTMNNPMPPWPATQALGPGVSINDSGVFIAAYEQNNQPWAIAGAVDSITSNVEVWSGSAIRYDLGTTSGPASIALSNAVSGSRCVWVAVHRDGNQYFWDGGTVDEQAKTMIPWTQNSRFDYGTSDPAVAINDNGTVLSVHSGTPDGSTTENCYYNVGVVNPSTKTVTWSGGVLIEPGSSPSVAITNKGLVLCTWVNDPTGHPSIYYRVGMLEPASGGIAWASDAQPLTFDQGQPARGGGAACAMLEDGTAFVCFYPHSSAVGNPCTIVAGSLGEDWSQWTPPAGASWSTFSGRWGGPPQGNAVLSFGNKEIYPIGDAPQGPLQHAEYFFGPA